MNMVISMQSTFTPARHQVYARLFGRCIEKIRSPSVSPWKKRPLWLAWSPRNGRPSKPVTYLMMTVQLQSMAGALECHYDQIVRLAFVCKDAWGL